MARVQLYLRPAKGSPVFRFVRPGGVRDAIPALWVFAYVDLMRYVRPGTDTGVAAYPECVVDTGCHLTVIPERVWGQLKTGIVTPLPFDPAMPAVQRSASLAGGTFPYRLGELTIRLCDLAGRTMDVTVVAQLVEDEGKFTASMILGLRGGVLDGRVFRAEPDTAAPFGQAWLIEDP